MPTLAAVLAELRAKGSERDRQGMARDGIKVDRAFGVRVWETRALGRRIGQDHALARALWATGWHEARMLAAFVEEPAKVTPAQMDRWARAFDSWDVCDTVCGSVFAATPHAVAKALGWSRDRRELVKRAGFVLMAELSHQGHALPAARYRQFLKRIEAEAHDERNFVRKAVNWALRDIGKRRQEARRDAVALARRLAASEDKAERWVGRDALREFRTKGLAR